MLIGKANGPGLFSPGLFLSGGAAGNRTRYKNALAGLTPGGREIAMPWYWAEYDFVLADED